MRLLGRGPSVEELTSASNENRQLGRVGDVPKKAQKTLGTKSNGASSKNKRYPEVNSTWNPLIEEKRSLAAFRRSQDADSDTMPGARTGAPLPYMPPPPKRSQTDLGDYAPSSSADRTGTQTQYGDTQMHQSSIESMNREYYDSAKQPLYVSQQTSASAVRDMALRKGAPVVRHSASNPNLTIKPLKSAMKQPKSKLGPDGAKKLKKIDITSLFPQPKSNGGHVLSPSKLDFSPSNLTDGFDFFPEEPIHAQVQRQGPNGRFETQRTMTARSAEPNHSNGARVKIFESDVYDHVKTTSRKPPKGIQNWFDGFDISSDEEDEEQAVPLTTVVPAPREASPTLPSPYSQASGENTPVKRPAPQPMQNGSQPNSRSKDDWSRRMLAKRSESSMTTGSASSGAMPGRKRSNESRIAHSRLGAESVLSLSSESEDDNKTDITPVQNSARASSVFVGKASSQELQKPQELVHEVQHQHSPVEKPRSRQSRPALKSAQSSRSKVNTIASASSTVSDPRLRAESGGLSESAVAALRKIHALQESASQPSRSRPNTRNTNDDNKPPPTSYSTPSDASRIMEVSEEEMILLELMRQKRAAMQKNSFSEGYRLALQQDKHSRQPSGASTQDPALLVLKNEAKAIPRSRGPSRTESFMREEIEQRRRMSAIRKEDVDKSFKMGRFLSMEGSAGGERPTKMERFLAMAPGLADELTGRPISGTEIEVDSGYEDSRFSEEMRSKGELDSRYAGTEIDSQYELEGREDSDMDTPQLPPLKSFSPMEKFTDAPQQGQRSGSRSAERAANVDLEKVRALLASRHALERTSRAGSRNSGTPEKNRYIRPGVLPSPMASEPGFEFPDIPEEAEHSYLDRPTNNIEAFRSKLQHAPHASIGDPRVKAVSTPVGGIQQPHPYRPSPGLDFAPLELPYAQSGTPSVTTSRPSPLTPTFVTPNGYDKSNVEIASTDAGSFRSDRYAPESEHVSTVSSHSAAPANSRRSSKKPPPRVDTFSNKPAGRTSMNSITSAGEDVLAAWAELGGGDAFPNRRKKAR